MIESKELDKLNKDLNKISKELFKISSGRGGGISDDITKRLAIGMIDIRNTIILSMRNTPKTGKHYKKGKKTHIASSPGNPPAIDSGDMIKSIIFDVREMEAEVGSVINVPPYPRYLEESTEKMEARPWLSPAVEKHHKEIIDDIGESVFELIKKPFKGK